MKIKLSELIEDEAERMFIASLCKNIDEYLGNDCCGLIDIIIGIRESMKVERSEIFELWFNTNLKEDNCWISLCNGTIYFYGNVDKKLLKEYVYGSKDNPDKIDLPEKLDMDAAAREELTSQLEYFLDFFIGIWMLSHLEIKHFRILLTTKRNRTRRRQIRINSEMSNMQKFIAIGNKVRVNGHIIQCKELDCDLDDFDCKYCFFKNYPCPLSPFYCKATDREDETDVYFAEGKE